MTPRSTFSTLLLAFYLLVAGGLPLADALLERGGASTVAEGGSRERSPAPPHDESCPLCVLLERVATAEVAPGGTPDVHVAVAAPHWNAADPLLPARLARARSARSPPA